MKRTLFLTLLVTLCALFSCKGPEKAAYAGTYLDEDTRSPFLTIIPREDGRYDVEIGIYRLTTFDDAIGTVTDQGLTFTATDGSGNPIGGVITLEGDTATVTFTDSTWPLLENGSAFKYTRQK